MENKYYTYTDIPKTKRNAVRRRLKGIEKKHGYEILRKVAMKYFEEVKNKEKLRNKIKEAEEKLRELNLEIQE